MPVKILLADKSITIQKVVEMLFSGKEYEVTCVSDGESAISEATRIVPDVVLADVDLPRIDGYAFSGRLRETPALAKVPVILMLSRDDAYDAMKGKLAGLVDNIAKPFESQELIGKVKKALTTTPPSAAAPATRTAAAVAPPPPPKPAAAPAPPPKPVIEPAPMPKPAAEAAPVTPPRREAVPKDIFDIIDEAPAKAEAPASATPSAAGPGPAAKPAEPEEETFEVEPEYEVEPELEPEKPAPPQQAMPAAAPEDAWAGLMAEERASKPAPSPPVAASSAPKVEADAFDTDKLFGREPVPAEEAVPAAVEPPPSFDFSEPLPAEAEVALPMGQRAMDEMREGLGLGGDAAAASDMHPDIVSFESLDMASRASHEDYTFAPPAAAPAPPVAAPAVERPAAPPRYPDVSDELFKGAAKDVMEKTMREVLERVAWEIIPDLAERLIREEIERLKAGTK